MTQDRNPPAARERFNEFLIRRIVNAKARAGRLMRPGSTVVLLLVTITSAAAVLRQAEVPNSSFWRSRGPATISLVVIAALSYIGYCLVVIGFRRVLKHSDLETRLYTTCRDIAALAASRTQLAQDTIGAHVWVIRGVPGFRRLERRVRFVSRDRPESSITWRKGKGAAGRCWEQGRWVLADLSPLAAVATMSEGDFYNIEPQKRFGLTYKDATETAHYKAVLAYPIEAGPQNGRRLVAVVSVDMEAEGSHAALKEAWNADRGAFIAHFAVCEGILQ